MEQQIHKLQAQDFQALAWQMDLVVLEQHKKKIEQINTIISDYNRLYRSEETGILPKSRQAKLDAFLPTITMTTVCVTLEGQFLSGSDKVVAQVIAKPKLTPAERRAQRALEIADAKRLRTRLLEKYDDEFGGDEVPDDAIQAELDEMFGEDGEL